jgi:hypothetical protein
LISSADGWRLKNWNKARIFMSAGAPVCLVGNYSVAIRPLIVEKSIRGVGSVSVYPTPLMLFKKDSKDLYQVGVEKEVESSSFSLSLPPSRAD